MATFLAVDLGASSGRVVLAEVAAAGDGPPVLRLHEVHRFPHAPVPLPDGLHWDAVGLFGEVLTGLRRAGRRAADLGLPAPSSIGIDTWAVDYGLLDDAGALLGEPYAYRDPRGLRGAELVHASVAPERLYAVNGLQFLPFTTLYQLAAETGARRAAARTLLLLPDLLAYWLTGRTGTERTNASTTGLLDVRTGRWSAELLDALGIDPAVLPPLREPGDVVGPLLPHVAAETGLPAATPVVAVGSHDTASAVVGVPARGRRFAYVSCGTWSLVGLELDGPVLTAAGRAANFTNEAGVDGRVRYLRNVMGLWLLSESLRTWAREDGVDEPAELLPDLLRAAAARPAGGPVFDPDDPVLLPPGDQPERIRTLCGPAGLPSRAAVVRSIVDSLAAAYARAVADAVRLSGRSVDVVHLVGGGARNELLCALTARACGLPVVAGPVEATAVGNVLVQARAAGVLDGDLDDLRAVVRATQAVRTHLPDEPLPDEPLPGGPRAHDEVRTT